MNNSVFFGESGLTTTSANHIANLSKERISVLENEISNLSFINESVKLASSSEISILNQGTTSDELNCISDKLNEIAEFKCLIAWLREAIKAKESLTNQISSISDEDYSEKANVEVPVMPKKEHLLTVEEVVNALPIKERNRYFTIQTIAAVYGQAIHPRGAFSNAREVAQKRANKPNEVYGQGRDMTIYRYNPSVSLEDIDETFFKLQGIQREAQAELNGIKHNIDTQVTNQNIEVEKKFAADYKTYLAAMSAFNNEKIEWIHEQLNEVSKLRIQIPNSLLDTYKKVQELGK